MEEKQPNSPSSTTPGAVPASPGVVRAPGVEIDAIVGAIEALKAMMQDLGRNQLEAAARQRTLEEQTASSLLDMRNRIIMSEDDVREPEPRNARRESVMTTRSSLGVADLERNARQPIVTATVVQVQKAVPPEKIIKSISIPALRWAKKQQLIFERETEQLKSLADFLALDEVLIPILHNQQRLGTSIGELLTEDKMYELSDKSMSQMYMQHIRTHHVTRNGITAVITGMVNPLKAVHAGWTFGIKGYDINIHGGMCKLIEDIRKSWVLLTDGATPAEMEQWPAINQGVEKAPGVLGLFGLLLGPYRENFESMVTVDKLKRMTSVTEWCNTHKELNDMYCDEAYALDKKEAATTPHKPMKVVQQEFAERLASKSLYTRVLQRDPKPVELTRSTPQAPRPAAGVAYGTPRPQNYAPYQDTRGQIRQAPADSGVTQPNSADRSQYRPPPPIFARQSAIEDEEEYWNGVDESMRSDSSPERQHQRVFPATLTAYAEDDEYGEEESSFYPNLAAFSSQSEGRTLFDPKIRTPKNPDRACFSFFYTGECDNKCGYSHSADAMLLAKEQLMAKLLGSRWVKPDWVIGEATKARNPPVSQDVRGYQPRNASLGCIVEPPANTHASFGGLSPILAGSGQIWHDPAGIGTHAPTSAASSRNNPSVPPGSS